MEYMLMPLRRYAEFTGRSRRKEFWMFALLNFIVYAVIMALMFALGAGASMEDAAAGNYGAMFGGVGLLIGVWGLAVLVPSIAVSVRRLHDRDMSGWWYLGFIVASFIPILGIITSIGFLVLMLLPGTPGENRFGPDPKGAADPAVFA
jgi:uncharacterized membrane protein YhaH (DUF805 family)